MIASDPPVGEEYTPETQVANCCLLEARRQLGTSTVHRLFDLHFKEEWECNLGELFDTDFPQPVQDSGRLSQAAWRALSLVSPVKGLHGEGTPAVYSKEFFEETLTRKPAKIDTRVMSKVFFKEGRTEGVVCYEPCGGLCAGLEMLLRNGINVKKYLYQDISLDSQAVAIARCTALQRRYPDLLTGMAIQLDSLPCDLRATGVKDLVELQGDRPPAYILENVSPLAHKPGTKMREEVFPYIASIIGTPVSFDAVVAGSYAHRLRAYWSNLFQNHQFNMIMDKVERPKERVVSSILQKGTVVRSKGALHEEESREVNLEEKAKAMGYDACELRMAVGLDDERLAMTLGLTMDRRAMELLFAVAEASRRGLPHSVESSHAENASVTPLRPEGCEVKAVEAHSQQQQAMVADWVDKSSQYAQKVAKNMGHSNGVTESRAAYFRKLSRAGRLHVIGHLEHGPIGRRCMWVLVFRNPLVRAKMLSGGEAAGIGMFTFSLGKFASGSIYTDCAEQALI
ncbi:hypothetical protein CYMTET_9032 [Cymbomonas tetramitiformis]|uniref:Uncharacterized protein n=1 Tax=Cymbomonas tetramitiformis TaxID=36881 RepID=A0AAE0GSA1_9CHLO|nr:hypothetical protein CYMTET_9032 [Cymbomonas tetramitiformis]